MYQYNLGIRFQRVVESHASDVALWLSQDEQVRYEELNQLANRIARLLESRKVAPGHVVCLGGTKSVEIFAAMLACLKVGAIYCNVDPDSPPERLRKILSRCSPELVLADGSFLLRFAELIAELEIDTVETGLLGELLARFGGDNLEVTVRITGANPAYIMFTSGSTGFPKGAVMTHANVINLIEWSVETFQITSRDVLTNVNPLYFDNSVFDFYSSLFTGARMVPFSKEEVRDPKRLVDKVDASQATLWFSVPSLLIFLQTMKVISGGWLASVRRFVFGGEGYPKAKLRDLYEAYAHDSELFNVYGPTECTCICSSYKLSSLDFVDLKGLPPLGQIANNFSYLILDDQGRTVPPGETGELYLLGPNVGKGYFRDAERTKASFVQNPLHHDFEELMYKTGDMVRLDPTDGKLYIHGRKDNQIKHMGYRVELEEIEAALNCLDYVSEAAVIHRVDKGLSRIVAFVSGAPLDKNRIRQDLRAIIPDYMIPSAFFREEILPKNANGKVDRICLAQKYIDMLQREPK